MVLVDEMLGIGLALGSGLIGVVVEVVSTLLVVVVEGMLGIGLALGCGLIGVVVVGLRLVLCEYLVSGFEKRAEGLSTI